MIMAFPKKGSLEELSKNYLNESVKTTEDAIANASYIIAEWISDNAYYRKEIRNFIYKNGSVVSKIKKDAQDEKKTYEMYYDFNEAVKYIKHYRVLAINRGEKEKILTVNIDFNEEEVYAYLNKKIIKDSTSFVVKVVEDAIKDSCKRLIFPSIEREIRSELTEKADKLAIETFGVNLEHLLLTRPIKGMVVLGFDPGYVNGCKLAVVDKNGCYLDSCVIKPFLKNASEAALVGSKIIVKNLIEKPAVEEAPSNIAILGRYIITPEIFNILENQAPGKGGEIQLTDALAKLDKIYGNTFEGKTYDIGNRLEWLKTSIEFAMDDEESKNDLIRYMKEIIASN